MPVYIMMATLTPEGRKTLERMPDRNREVNQEIKQFGCELISQYAVLGLYDFVNIIEAPDNETIAHLAIHLGSRGTMNIMTLPAIPTESLLENIKSPRKASS